MTAVKKTQFELFVAMVENFTFAKDGMLEIDMRDVVANPKKYELLRGTEENPRIVPGTRLTTMSSNRLFEMYCHTTEVRNIEQLDTSAYTILDGKNTITVEKEVHLAHEFMIVDFDHNLSNDPDERNAQVTRLSARFEVALRKGVRVTMLDGETYVYKRVVRSASQTRSGKAYFTRLDVNKVRHESSFGAFFLDRTGEQNLAKLEARLGLATSSTLKLSLDFTFDVLPDKEIYKTHERIIVGSKVVDGKRELNITPPVATKDKYSPADGQGYVRPSYATKMALEARLINAHEYLNIMVMLTEYNEDIQAIHDLNDVDFNHAWHKVPTAFQVRFGLCKGLLVVFPFHLPQYRQDCERNTFRDKGLVMEYWEHAGAVDEDGKHYYDFDVDVMFTDSMWKENFDPAYLTHENELLRPKMELVLWNGNLKKETVFMGYQFWQALGDKVNIGGLAKRVLKDLEATIFTDAKKALLFLGAVEGGRTEDALQDRLMEQHSRVAKVQLTLMANPNMITDRYVKETLRQAITRFVERMRDDARVPVEGVNPYIIADPMPCFGMKPRLGRKEYYYNNMNRVAGGFRSPLVDESEAVVLQLVEKDEYRGLFRNILVMNWYDDTLPRMGGADTDGDKIALVFEKHIIKHIKTGLPMIVDAGENGQKAVMTEDNIADYDLKTILPEANGGDKVFSIGEITNFSTVWKDIKMTPNMVKMLGISHAELELKSKKLRGNQGISIDFAKTGVNVPVDEDTLVRMQPAWKKGMSLRKHLRNDNGDITVYVSESPVQKNWDYVNRVLENFDSFAEDVSDNNGYSFLAEIHKLDVIDYQEFDELTEIVGKIEADYRKTIGNASAYSDEDERMAFIANTIETYKFIIDTLPFSQATISAVAYQICYNSSSSKGKSVSFVWNCCFNGLLQLMESTQRSLLLRSLPMKIDASYLPEKLNVYNNKYSFEYTDVFGEEQVYNGKVLAPNGKYDTHVEGNRGFIQLKAGVASARKAEQIERRVAEYIGETMSATLLGFKYTDYTSAEFIDALKANDGVLTIVDAKRKSKGRAKKTALTVQIDGKQYGIVAEKDTNTFRPFMNGATDFEVVGYENLTRTYLKKGEETLHSVLTLGFIYVGPSEGVEEEVDEDNDAPTESYRDYGYSDDSGIPYYDGDSGVPYYPADDEAPEVDFDEEDELPESFDIDDEEAEEYGMKVPYSELFAIAPKKFNGDASELYDGIVGFDVEHQENNILSVLVYRDVKGTVYPAMSEVKVLGNGQLRFADEPVAKFRGKTINVGEQYTNMVMQIAKYAKSL